MDAYSDDQAVQPPGDSPDAAAERVAAWQARITALAAGMPAEAPLPDRWIEAAAMLLGRLLTAGLTVELVVPDDETLPELSSALDLDIRPLCLVLPEAEFASRIAMRATLTLLKSRLSRQADNDLVWQAQHKRIATLGGLWQAALGWGQSESSSTWPADIGHLFPARLLPASHAERLATPADVHILIAPERMPAATRDAIAARAVRLFCLSAWRRGIENRQLIPFDESVQQRFELDMLTREIAELELELATAQQEVANFSQRYYTIVGKRMVELDRLQAELATLRAGAAPTDIGLQADARERKAQADESAQEQAQFESIPRREAEPVFTPSKDLRKLYRQIAQKIHPDRADSEGERTWRTQLMAEATRAYRSEDTAALEEVLTRWQTGQTDADTARAAQPTALAQHVARMKQRLGDIQTELDRLLGSRLYELLVANRLASRQGRDLLQEISAQVEAQIATATAELTAFKTHQEGAAPCNADS